MILLTLAETYIVLPRFLSYPILDLTKHTLKKLEFRKNCLKLNQILYILITLFQIWISYINY